VWSGHVCAQEWAAGTWFVGWLLLLTLPAPTRRLAAAATAISPIRLAATTSSPRLVVRIAFIVLSFRVADFMARGYEGLTVVSAGRLTGGVSAR
jgi:hypothetical protein